MRLGALEESGAVPAGTVDAECSSKTPSWKKNGSRFAWNTFHKLKLGFKVKLSNFEFDTGGDSISVPYIEPGDLLKYFMEKHPDLVVGGLKSSQDRALHLKAFWEGYRLQYPDHQVFREHQGNLEYVLPIFYHGDEGRGKRRGNTVVLSMETPLGIHTSLRSRKRRRGQCDCQPPPSMQRKYNRINRGMTSLSPNMMDALMAMKTNMTANSFLQHWALFVIPSALHHANPELLKQLMDHIAKQFRILFFEGFLAGRKQYNVAICGHKGDLKWFTKVAMLSRSFEHQGRVRNIQCCHECMAGGDDLPWEDLNSETPCWAPTQFSVRPWTIVPGLASVPHCAAPEKQLMKDPFHILKVGVFRDHVASCISYLCHYGLFGGGDFDTKLKAAHGAFTLYCRGVGSSPALRSFSRALLNYPTFSSYPWCNTKGSDTMLLTRWLVVQITGFENEGGHGPHLEAFKLMKATSKAALGIFHVMNGHGLFLSKNCAIMQYTESVRFINGFTALANKCMNENFNLWGLKPKLHLFKHLAFTLHEQLSSGAEVFLNWNATNCEQNEDFIGKTCRLSRRMDSRLLCRRVLESGLLKSGLLFRKSSIGNCA